MTDKKAKATKATPATYTDHVEGNKIRFTNGRFYDVASRKRLNSNSIPLNVKKVARAKARRIAAVLDDEANAAPSDI